VTGPRDLDELAARYWVTGSRRTNGISREVFD